MIHSCSPNRTENLFEHISQTAGLALPVSHPKLVDLLSCNPFDCVRACLRVCYLPEWLKLLEDRSHVSCFCTSPRHTLFYHKGKPSVNTRKRRTARAFQLYPSHSPAHFVCAVCGLCIHDRLVRCLSLLQFYREWNQSLEFLRSCSYWVLDLELKPRSGFGTCICFSGPTVNTRILSSSQSSLS